MRYNYQEGVTGDKKRPVWIIWLLVLIVLAAAAYGTANYLAPRLVSMPLSAKASPDATMNKMQATAPKPDQQHLYIPQLNVDLPIATGDDVAVLADSAWQRGKAADPAQGEPLSLRALRFSLGSTPWETRERSRFYNLDKLQVGDQVYVDHDGKRYAYRVKAFHQKIPEVKTADDKKSALLLIPADETGDLSAGPVVEAESAGVVGEEE